jgi:hypothetical protein
VIEAMSADPFIVADDGFAAAVAIVAIGRDIDGRGGYVDRRGMTEAKANDDLGLRLGWGREEERAGGDCGDDGPGNESFYIGDFHNGLLTTLQ